ncbi:MAG: acyltransferase family protein [Vulcanimicrobiota bacterium]
MSDTLKYRRDIDGLRAVSVLLVVFFHADLLKCQSGYIGVDVFFVISGYLVSQVILRELDAGSFSLAAFFARRIRRLLPALLAVCVVTPLAGWFLMLPEEYRHLGAVLVSQPLLAANFVYAQTMTFGYFGTNAENYPLLHLWSLAVEEQFYLLFPLLLMAIYPRLSRPGRTWLLALLGLLSYAWSVWGTPRFPVSAYFLLPTRAFEILAGALAGQSGWRPAPWIREAASWLAVYVLVASAWRSPDGTPFPGAIAILPTLSAAVLLWLGAQGGSRLHRLLSVKPLVVIGLGSYSMYLWHWPVIALLRSSLLWKPFFGTYWLILLFPISYLSWRYIEQPLRRRQLSHAQAFRLAASAGFTVAATGAVIWLNQGFPARLPQHSLRLAAQEFTPNPFIQDHTVAMIEGGQLSRFGAPGAASLLVIGDSHAMAVLPGLDLAGRERGLTGVAITRSSTPPLYCELNHNTGLRGQQLRDFCGAIQRQIQRQRPQKILLVASWWNYQREPGFAQGLAETVRLCASKGRRCYLMGMVPDVARKVPRALAFAQWRGGTAWDIRVPLAEQRERNQHLRAMLDGLPVTYIDPLPFFEGEAGRVAVLRDGLALYRDEGHLSVDGSRLFAPLLLDGLQIKRSQPEQ